MNQLVAAATAQKSRLPVLFLAHGSPNLIMRPRSSEPQSPTDVGGPNGRHVAFLKELGPYIINELKPKAIVVFSAHWETNRKVQVMSYSGKNELYYDYGGFPDYMYDLDDKFVSHGSPAVASRIVELCQKNGIAAESITSGRGLDHGVFVPFIVMFPSPVQIPIIEVSMPSLDPTALFALGKALAPLRDEGILIISGGLTIHTFREWDAWDPVNAPQGFKDFENGIKSSITETSTSQERSSRLFETIKHPYFRRAHPREEHYVPIFVASGAGSLDDDAAAVISDLHGAITIAFGI